MLSGTAVYAWSGGPTTKIRDLPASVQRENGGEIVGLTDDGVIVSDGTGVIFVVPFAGGEPRELAGALVAVVP